MLHLKPAVSALARQTMKIAFDGLEQTITPSDARNFRTTTLQQVREDALVIEQQLATKQALRNMRRLNPLFKGLEHYAKAVDVLCNGTPYLAWIWAPITLILRLASDYIEAFEKLMKGYSSIADALGRFEILSDAFKHRPDFQQTVAVFYADILQFHSHAYKFVRRSGWKVMFLTSWGRFQRRFDNILEDLKRHGELIDQEANALDIAEASRMRHDILCWREESLEQLKREEEERVSKQFRSIASWLKIDESEQLSIYDTTLEEGSRYPGTCSWLLQHPKICAWLQRKPENPFVWLQGNAGTGKSILAAQLVGYLRVANSNAVSHFCTYSYASSTKYECILKSMLLQLLRENGELVAYAYQECVLGKKSPSISTIEHLLYMISVSISNGPREIQYAWIIVDGLDECELERQPRLLSLLNQITTKATPDGGIVCKVLVSSRLSPIISKHLRKKQLVSLSAETDHLKKAIKAYASRRLASSSEKFRQLELESEEIEEIEGAIVEKSDGMFLYARLLLDYITANVFFSGAEMHNSIHQLPQTLADFYHTILMQILARLDSRSVQRISSVLSWVAFANRPLKKFELLSAVTFGQGETNVDRLVPQYILDICSPLIEERRDTTLAFIHVSVKEFLQSSLSSVVIHEQEARREHGVAAITCLISGLQVFGAAFDRQKQLLRLIKGVHGFHVYATEYWSEYLLSDALLTDGPVTSSPLFVTATQLADRLEETAPVATLTLRVSGDSIIDERLLLFREYQTIYKHVEAALNYRSQKHLEHELTQGHGRIAHQTQNSHALDGISKMLQSYQQAIEVILQEDSYPGVSAEELELFKNHFRTSAYTCRLRLCPRATVGFENEQLRHEHEITHATFRCIQPGCLYPPFRSAQTLKVHMNSCHNILPPRKPIRKAGTENLRNQQLGFKLPSETRIRKDDRDIKTEISTHFARGKSTQNEENNKEQRFSQTIRPEDQGTTQAYILDYSRLQPLLSNRSLIEKVSNIIHNNPRIFDTSNNEHFPENIINPQRRNYIPSQIQTWIELKQWLISSPHCDIGPMPIEVLQVIEAYSLMLFSLLPQQERAIMQRVVQVYEQLVDQPRMEITSPDLPNFLDGEDILHSIPPDIMAFLHQENTLGNPHEDDESQMAQISSEGKSPHTGTYSLGNHASQDFQAQFQFYQQLNQRAIRLLMDDPKIIHSIEHAPFSSWFARAGYNIPSEVRTWAQLQEWAANNPRSKLSVQQIQHYQALDYIDREYREKIRQEQRIKLEQSTQLVSQGHSATTSRSSESLDSQSLPSNDTWMQLAFLKQQRERLRISAQAMLLAEPGIISTSNINKAPVNWYFFERNMRETVPQSLVTWADLERWVSTRPECGLSTRELHVAQVMQILDCQAQGLGDYSPSNAFAVDATKQNDQSPVPSSVPYPETESASSSKDASFFSSVRCDGCERRRTQCTVLDHTKGCSSCFYHREKCTWNVAIQKQQDREEQLQCNL